MRTASYLGFAVMVAIAVAAFVLFDQWWAILLGLLVAAAVGWYSLGLYEKASIGSARRLVHGAATDEDYAAIAELPAHARSAAIRAAADAPDPQRDRLFQEFLDRAGGLEAAQTLVIEHMARKGFDLDGDTALDLLYRWRMYGIVRDESLGDYLDETARRSQPST